MAVPNSTSSGSARQAPRAEAKQEPKEAPKKPQDNSAAKQAPRETKSAVNNAFGKVPQEGNARQPGNDAKQPGNEAAAPKATPHAGPATQQIIANPQLNLKKSVIHSPGADPKTANLAGDKATPPADPRVQSILDAKRSDGKTVKDKLDADAPAYLVKAAQDHYNKQKEAGEQPDAISRFYLNTAARDIAKNGIEHERVEADKMAGVFNLERIDQNIKEASTDPAFLQWATEQQANSIQNTINANPDIAKLVQPYLQEGENHVNALRRMQSDYMGSQEFADGVARDGKDLVTEGMKTLSSLGLGEKEMLGVSNTLAENIRSKYTPDAPKMVIDPQTNKPVQTQDGYSMATLPDGTVIGLGTDGKAVADQQGNPYVYNADGSARVDTNNRYVQYDMRARAAYTDYDGTRYMVDADGKSRVDAQGRPLAIDSGAPVAVGKNGKAVTDVAGNKLVFDPETGKAVTDPESGNAVIIDPETRAVVQADAGGKIVAGKDGDPYAADRITGKFVVDAQGRTVRISKENVAPGILPGYVVDANNTRMVVSPANGTPMVDPASGMSVILDPMTHAPRLVPLDANGAPMQAADGKGIVFDENGHTVVPGEAKGPNWLVDANGSYVQNADGNAIGVDSNAGLAAPVDANGFIRNAGGMTPLWDIKANTMMVTKDGNPVVADEGGNLHMSDAQGQTIVEEKTGLPYLLDPNTKETIVNPDTGRSILLDRSGLPVEYNADDGYKYLINPETGTTVKTADGHAVTTDDNGVPYAVRQDGSAVKNPDTGNTVVYGIDGLPAKEQSTGYPIEITASGDAHVIDKATHAPMAERDPQTGGYQLFNEDGSEAVNPDSGNRIQIVPGTGMKVEIDPKTDKPATDSYGHPLAMGADNRPLKTPGGHAVAGDLKTGLPVSIDTNGNLVRDPASGLPLAVDPHTGMPLADPDTRAPVVADPASRQPVQVDAAGRIITDPLTGMPVAINTRTGAQIKGPDGALAVNDPRTGLPVIHDKESGLFTVVDPGTGKALTDPETGAKTVVDTGSGMIFHVLPDAQGNHIIVDKHGQPVKDDNDNQPYFDKDTGTLVTVNGKGEAADPRTGKAPEKFDPKNLVYTTPLLMTGPPALAVLGGGRPAGIPLDIDEIVTEEEAAGVGNAPLWIDLPPPSPSAAGRPWEVASYTMTPEERAAFIEAWNEEFPDGVMSYDAYLDDIKTIKRNYPTLQGIPDLELAAVRSYTNGPWWEEMNKAMRTGDPDLLRKYDLHIKAMSSGLTYLQEAGFVYQGPTYRYLDMTPEQFSEAFGGDIYVNRQFMSTSAHEDGAYSSRNTRVKVIHLSGVDISTLSELPAEGEVAGQPARSYAISKFRKAGTRRRVRTRFWTRKINKVTLTERPPDHGKLLGGNPNFDFPGGSQAARNWARIGKALGYAAEGLEILGGAAQAVFGGLQVDEGIKTHDPYDIAAGTLNVASGAASIGASVASLIGGAAAIAMAPLTVAGIVLGGIAGIVDFAGSLDDDEEFADGLEQDFGPLGILQEGWREKAQEAYKDGNEKHIQPDYTA